VWHQSGGRSATGEDGRRGSLSERRRVARLRPLQTSLRGLNRRTHGCRGHREAPNAGHTADSSGLTAAHLVARRLAADSSRNEGVCALVANPWFDATFNDVTTETEQRRSGRWLARPGGRATARGSSVDPATAPGPKTRQNDHVISAQNRAVLTPFRMARNHSPTRARSQG